MTEQQMAAKFTTDSCVGIKVYENPNVGYMIRTRIGLDEDSVVYVTSQTKFEVTKLGYDFDKICAALSVTLGCRVIPKKITYELFQKSRMLEQDFPTLHAGDSAILAFAIDTKSTLITCDRDLLVTASGAGVNSVNPDLLPCEHIRRPKSRVQMMARAAIKSLKRDSDVKKTARKKIQSVALKPGQKILWRSFV